MTAEPRPRAPAVRIGIFAAVGGVAGACAWLSASTEAEPLPPVVAEPGSVTPPVQAPPPAAAAAPMAGSALGLILYGVSGGTKDPAAIIGQESGGQRLVAVGRDFRPGLKLTEVGQDYAILLAGDRAARLELRRFGGALPGRPLQADGSAGEQRIEAAVLRNMLKPVVSNGRIGGYALKGGESLPQIRQAGLQPGDVIVSVNGSQFDEERMGELAWEMRNTSKTEFVFLRGGKRMRASV
ncbi:MAG TPA: type II secretion system protein N [Allosphingosinicella sp.]